MPGYGGAWSGAVGQVRGNYPSAMRRANLVKNDHFSYQSTPIFAGSLADIAISPRHARYSILARPKKWSILYRRAVRRGPNLIALCVSRLSTAAASVLNLMRSLGLLGGSNAEAPSRYEGGVGLLGGQSCSENSLPNCKMPVHLRKRL